MAGKGDSGQIASHTLANNRQARRIHPNRSAMFSDPGCRGVGLLGGNGIFGLRRARILHEHDGYPRTSSDLTHEAIVCLSITEDPPTSVEVYDPWEDATLTLWSNDTQRNLTSRTTINGAVRTRGWQR